MEDIVWLVIKKILECKYLWPYLDVYLFELIVYYWYPIIRPFLPYIIVFLTLISGLLIVELADYLDPRPKEERHPIEDKIIRGMAVAYFIIIIMFIIIVEDSCESAGKSAMEELIDRIVNDKPFEEPFGPEDQPSDSEGNSNFKPTPNFTGIPLEPDDEAWRKFIRNRMEFKNRDTLDNSKMYFQGANYSRLRTKLQNQPLPSNVALYFLYVQVNEPKGDEIPLARAYGVLVLLGETRGESYLIPYLPIKAWQLNPEYQDNLPVDKDVVACYFVYRRQLLDYPQTMGIYDQKIDDVLKEWDKDGEHIKARYRVEFNIAIPWMNYVEKDNWITYKSIDNLIKDFCTQEISKPVIKTLDLEISQPVKTLDDKKANN